MSIESLASLSNLTGRTWGDDRMGGSDYLPEPLTERELDILRLLAEGLTDREIAQRLVIAQGTVKWYNKQIYQKLSGQGRTGRSTKEPTGYSRIQSGEFQAQFACTAHFICRPSNQTFC
jgi:DNA-binding CsgD family transcriptional regulator